MGQRWLDGYSTDVEIYLLLDGKRVDVAQVSGSTLVLQNAVSIPNDTEAILVLRIDGHEERERIFISSGVESRDEILSFI